MRVLPRGGAGGATGPQPGQEIPVEQMSGGVRARMRPDLSVGAALPPAGRQRRGSGSPGAWHVRVVWVTMPGWLVMIAVARCCSVGLLPIWMGPGPRGCSDGWARSPRLLPRLWSGPGTGPPDAGGEPWPRGWALLATGWWRGGLGTEAPTPAEARQNRSAEHPAAAKGGGVSKPAATAPAAARTQTPAARRLAQDGPPLSARTLLPLSWGWSSACGGACAGRGG